MLPRRLLPEARRGMLVERGLRDDCDEDGIRILDARTLHCAGRHGCNDVNLAWRKVEECRVSADRLMAPTEGFIMVCA